MQQFSLIQELISAPAAQNQLISTLSTQNKIADVVQSQLFPCAFFWRANEHGITRKEHTVLLQQ